ncbi:MAG TPA: flippase [Anaerolineae bacterium]|nr:flippase [Anaerolineae bacterium]
MFRLLRQSSQKVNLGRISRNTIILLLLAVSKDAITIPFLSFIARSLGPDGFGLYSVAMSYVAIFMAILDIGAGKILTREISKSKKDVGSLTVINSFFALKIPILLLTVGGTIILLRLISYSMEQQVNILLTVFIAFAMSLAIAARAVFHAFQEMEYDIVGILGERFVTILFAVIAVTLGLDVLGVLLAFLLGNIADACLSWYLVHRKFIGLEPSFSKTDTILYFRVGFPVLVTALFSTLYLRVGPILLERFVGETAAGLFQAGFHLFVLGLYIPQMMGLAIFPVFSRLAYENRIMLESVWRRSAFLMFLAGVILALSIAVISNWFIPFLYGEDFSAAIGVVQLLVWSLPFSFASVIMAQLLVALDQQAVVAKIAAVASVINIGLSLWLIPVWEMNGAAFAVALTEVFICLQYVIILFWYRNSYEKLD